MSRPLALTVGFAASQAEASVSATSAQKAEYPAYSLNSSVGVPLKTVHGS